MNKPQKIEQAFSENLDRILAGQAVKVDTIDNADMLSALDFAASIADVKPAVPQQFQARLKAELLAKLQKQDVEKKTGGWFTNILQRASFRAITRPMPMV